MPCTLALETRSLLAGDPLRELHLDLPASPPAVRLARDFVASTLNGLEAAVPEQARWAARLVASELVTNAVMHARTTIDVGVVCTCERVLIAVSDKAAAPRTWSGDTIEADESGRGMVIITTIADDFGWLVDPEGNGKTMWAVVCFTEADVPSPTGGGDGPRPKRGRARPDRRRARPDRKQSRPRR